MRRLWLVLVACAGCDTIWRLDTVHDRVVDAPPPGDGAPQDAAIDGTLSGSLSITIPQAMPLWVGDTVQMQAFVHGPPNVTVAASVGAQSGSAAPPSSMFVLDGNGIGPWSFVYTAPSTAGQDVLTFRASASQLAAVVPMQLNIAPLTSAGIDSAQQLQQAIGANDAIGAKVTLSSGGELRKVGFWASSAGTNVRVGVYTVDSTSGGPLMRLAADTAPHAVVMGRNEIDVTPVTLLAGTYWMVAVFDGSTQIQYTNTGIYGSSTFTYGAMPQQWSSTWIDVLNSTFAFFLRIGM